MKRKIQVAVVSVLLFAAHGAVMAANQPDYPSDAEASYSLAALDTYADQQARKGGAEQPQSWGVGKREVKPHDPFPFGGGPVDD